MRMQCIRCLSSTFIHLGAKGCEFCFGKEVKQIRMNVSSRPTDGLTVTRVQVKEPRR